jgi:hypothetical protein
MSEALRYWKNQHPTFGLRTHWECLICGAKGCDQPAPGLTAAEMAQTHMERARSHYNHFRLEVHENDRSDELLAVMREELSIFAGRIPVVDCATLGARIGSEHYGFALRERDGQLASLMKERNLLRRKLDDLVREARGTLRESGWTLRDELGTLCM